jgi:hypothetical protein
MDSGSGQGLEINSQNLCELKFHLESFQVSLGKEGVVAL